MGAIIKTNEKQNFFDLSSETRSITKPLEKCLDINYFHFKRTFKDGSKAYLTSNTDYLNAYFEKDFFMIGEKEGSLDNYYSCYQVWGNLSDPHGIYQYVSDVFDISNGLTITRWNPEFCDFFIFATKKNNTLINTLYIERSDIFHNFCDHFLRSASSIIKNAVEKRVYWPLSSPLNIDSIPTDFKLDELMYAMCKNNGLWEKLSPKELECTHSLMQGKSNKMIARDLSISPRTVEDHLKNIRQKLGCHTRIELVSLLCLEIPH